MIAPPDGWALVRQRRNNVKSLIRMNYDRGPQTYYASQIYEELKCDILRQIILLDYRKLQILSVDDLKKIEFQFTNA